MNKVILLFFLIGLVLSLCGNPAQPQGKCTSCSPTDILINGSCYNKIRGCLRHLPGPLCQECQSGYVLNIGACVRQAIYLNKTNLNQIPPVKIDNLGVLTIVEAKNKLGEDYGVYFSDAHSYFMDRYGELAGAKIRDVQKMETKKGTFIVIEYSVDTSKRYEATSFIDLTNDIREWSFAVITTKKRDPISAESAIRQALATRLKQLVTFQMRQEGDFLIFDFTDGDVQVVRVIINRNDLLLSTIADKMRVENLKISDLGI